VSISTCCVSFGSLSNSIEEAPAPCNQSAPFYCCSFFFIAEDLSFTLGNMLSRIIVYVCLTLAILNNARSKKLSPGAKLCVAGKGSTHLLIALKAAQMRYKVSVLVSEPEEAPKLFPEDVAKKMEFLPLNAFGSDLLNRVDGLIVVRAYQSHRFRFVALHKVQLFRPRMHLRQRI